MVARHLEVPQGARRLSGRGEVPAEHRGDLFGAALRRGLQRPGGPAVQPPALRAQQPVVGRLLDEGVTEAVDGLGVLGHLLQQVLGAQLGQGRPQRLVRGAHRGQQREPELGPEHGRGADGVARRRAEPVHPGPDETLQGLGHLRARGRADLPDALLAHQGLRFKQRGQPLLQEQRVALDAGEHGVQDLLARRLADERPGQFPFGLLRQRPEGDRVDGQPGAFQAGHLGASFGPAGRQHEQPAARSQPGQVEGQAQRGRVGPVQVLQDENRRGGRHQPRHHRTPGGERLPLQVLRAHPAQRRSRRQAHHAGQQREQVVASHRGQRPLQGRPDHRRGLVRRHSRPVGQQLLVEAVGRG